MKISLRQIYSLLLIFVVSTSCREKNNTHQTKKSIPSETKEVMTSQSPNSPSETKKIVSSPGPTSVVRTIRQDRKGNIWIASWEGIFRYDGKFFINITKGVSSARFFSILEDRKGNLWFGSVGSGVFYYDGNSFQNYTTKDGLASNTVLNIYEDKTGNIWFAGDGASWYDGKSFRNFTTKEGLSNNDVNWIFQDNKGKFWFGTRGNISVFDGKTFTTVADKNGKAFMNVWCIIEDKNGNVLFSENDGIWSYDGNTFTNISQQGAISIIEDKKGNIWTSAGPPGDNWGLFRYDEQSLSNKKPTATFIKSPYKGFVFGILEAFDGSIWLGTDTGVYWYDGNTFNDFKDN